MHGAGYGNDTCWLEINQFICLAVPCCVTNSELRDVLGFGGSLVFQDELGEVICSTEYQ